MFEHSLPFPWVNPVCRYRDTDHLLASLGSEVIKPTQGKAEEIEQRKKEVERRLARQ